MLILTLKHDDTRQSKNQMWKKQVKQTKGVVITHPV